MLINVNVSWWATCSVKCWKIEENHDPMNNTILITHKHDTMNVAEARLCLYMAFNLQNECSTRRSRISHVYWEAVFPESVCICSSPMFKGKWSMRILNPNLGPLRQNSRPYFPASNLTSWWESSQSRSRFLKLCGLRGNLWPADCVGLYRLPFMPRFYHLKIQ